MSWRESSPSLFWRNFFCGAIATISVRSTPFIPHEMGHFFVLIFAGFTRTRALFVNFLSALFAVLGTVVALLLSARVEHFAAAMLPLAAGGFIYIAGSDLVPELNKEIAPAKSMAQVLAIGAGVGLMMLLTLVE